MPITGDSSIGLIFNLKADDKDATATIRNFRGTVAREMESLVRSLPGGNVLANFAQGIGRDSAKAAQGMKGAGAAGEGMGALMSSGSAKALIGIAGLAIAAVGLGVAFFSMSKNAAEAGSEIFDLSEKTGFGAENISALGVAARQSGSDVQTVGNALVKFTNNLADADRGNEKLAASFAKMGINVKEGLRDPEAALAKFIENFAKLPTEQEKVIYASEIFGKRTGAALVGTFNTVGGNLDEFKKKVKGLGQLWTDDAAKAADEFGDQLSEMSEMFSGLTNEIGREFMPVILGALKGISSWFMENREAIVGFIKFVGSTLELVVIMPLKAIIWLLGKLIEGIQWAVSLLPKSNLFGPIADAIKKQQDARKAALGPAGFALDAPATKKPKARPDVDLADAPGGGGGTDPREAQIAEIERQSKKLLTAYQTETEALKREYDLQTVNLAKFTEQTIAQANDYYNKRVENIEKRKALAKADAQAELDDELEEAKRDRDKAILAAQDDRDKKELDALRAHRDALLELADEYDSQAIESIRRRADMEAITSEAAERQIADRERAAYERRRQVLIDAREALYAAVKDQTDIDKALNEKAIQDIADQIKQLDAIEGIVEGETEIFSTGGEREARQRRIEAGIAKDLENARQHARERARIDRETLLAASEVGYARIADMEARFEDEREIIRARMELDLEVARVQHEAALDEIEEDRRIAMEEAKSAEDRLAIQASFSDQYLIELQRYLDEKARIEREARMKALEEDPTSDASLFGPEFQARIDEGMSRWEAFGNAVTDALKKQSDAAGNFGTIITSVFNQLGQAVGNVVRSFVLFGTAGTSFRKFAAEVIASVAQMAAVKAVFEFAEGLAMSALAWFTGNPKYAASAGEHYAAAALYGTVAAVAAVAGRLVAGDAFKTPAAGAGGGAGGSGGGGGRGENPADREPTIINMGRDQVIREIIEIRLEDGLLANHLTRDINKNGRASVAIQNLAGIATGVPTGG